MSLHIPLMTLLMIALAASMLLVPKHDAPRPGYAIASDAATSQATPYGSSAALRNLLF